MEVLMMLAATLVPDVHDFKIFALGFMTAYSAPLIVLAWFCWRAE
jgi:hypothetical protein